MALLRYAWYGCPHSGAFVQLALFFRGRCVGQWTMPRVVPGSLLQQPKPGVCLETTEELADAKPLISGLCWLLNEKRALNASVLRQAVASGRLMLQMQDAVTGSHKTYSLIRLRAHGIAWLLGPVTYQPRLTAAERHASPA